MHTNKACENTLFFDRNAYEYLTILHISENGGWKRFIITKRNIRFQMWCESDFINAKSTQKYIFKAIKT